MSDYRHRKGIIQDNVLAALIHDPLYRQRVEKYTKGKGSYRRKDKHNKKGSWEANDKQPCLSLAFHCNQQKAA